MAGAEIMNILQLTVMLTHVYFWLENGASDRHIGRHERLKSPNWQREFKHFRLAALPVKDVISVAAAGV